MSKITEMIMILIIIFAFILLILTIYKFTTNDQEIRKDATNKVFDDYNGYRASCGSRLSHGSIKSIDIESRRFESSILFFLLRTCFLFGLVQLIHIPNATTFPNPSNPPKWFPQSPVISFALYRVLCSLSFRRTWLNGLRCSEFWLLNLQFYHPLIHEASSK